MEPPTYLINDQNPGTEFAQTINLEQQCDYDLFAWLEYFILAWNPVEFQNLQFPFWMEVHEPLMCANPFTLTRFRLITDHAEALRVSKYCV